MRTKAAVHPWIRLNRVVRDIPNPSIIAGNGITNLRQLLLPLLKSANIECRCIRCREVKTSITNKQESELKVRLYLTYGGLEYFLSYESPDQKKMFGFLRLRIPQDLFNEEAKQVYSIYKKNQIIFPELDNAGLIRELHVYGQLVASQEKVEIGDNRSQHHGFGKKMLLAAEIIALYHNKTKMAVIAGVGTRNYYRKFGYETEKYFMTKALNLKQIKECIIKYNLNSDINVQQFDVQTNLKYSGESQESNKNLSVKEIVLSKGDLNPALISHCQSEFIIPVPSTATSSLNVILSYFTSKNLILASIIIAAYSAKVWYWRSKKNVLEKNP